MIFKLTRAYLCNYNSCLLFQLSAAPKQEEEEKATKTEVVFPDSVYNWSQEEQRKLEAALRKFPKGTHERWERIAAHVQPRTKVTILLLIAIIRCENVLILENRTEFFIRVACRPKSCSLMMQLHSIHIMKSFRLIFDNFPIIFIRFLYFLFQLECMDRFRYLSSVMKAKSQ